MPSILKSWNETHTGKHAYFGPFPESLRKPDTSLPVRIIRVYKSGVRVRFADGHQETVHPEHLYI